MPALPPYIIEPIFEQFSALLPEREVNHPLGCHRPRIPDRLVFEKLIQVLVFGCAYWRIADEECSETTLRRRRDEWIELGVMDALRETWHNAHKKLVWCTERQGRVIDFWMAFSDVIIIVRRLIREAWSRYRWESRPSRRP